MSEKSNGTTYTCDLCETTQIVYSYGIPSFWSVATIKIDIGHVGVSSFHLCDKCWTHQDNVKQKSFKRLFRKLFKISEGGVIK